MHDYDSIRLTQTDLNSDSFIKKNKIKQMANTTSLCVPVVVCVHVLVIYCIGFYLWNEETQWAGLTLGLFIPGTAVQLLSMKWYYDDGDDRRCYLSIIHILHLGIFKRYEKSLVSYGNAIQVQ